MRNARDPNGLTVAVGVGTSSLACLANDQQGTGTVAIDSALAPCPACRRGSISSVTFTLSSRMQGRRVSDVDRVAG
jgi:hypothetical protein